MHPSGSILLSKHTSYLEDRYFKYPTLIEMILDLNWNRRPKINNIQNIINYKSLSHNCVLRVVMGRKN